MQEFKIISQLNPLLKANRSMLMTVVGAGMVGILFESVSIGLLIPFIYSLESEAFAFESDVWLVNAFNDWLQIIPAENRITTLLIAIFALIILKSFVDFAYEYVYSKGFASLAYKLRQQVFHRLMSVEMRFIDRFPSGKLVNTLNDQTWSTADTLFSVAGIYVNIFSICLLTLLLFLVSWQLTLFVFVIGGLISLVTRQVTKQITKLSAEGVRAEEKLTSQILRSIQGIRTVRMFNQQENEGAAFNDLSKEIKQVFFKSDILSSLIQPISEILAMGFVAAAFLWLARYPDQLPLVITLVIVLYRLHPQIVMLDETRTDLLASSASINAVLTVLNAKNDEPKIGKEVAQLNQSVEFSNVSFAYAENGENVLDQISLSFKKGETTAIVGPSGSGKSTLINLLLGFYPPSTGEILIDNQPIGSLNIASWRKHIAVVSQDIQLFDLSILDNISYGSPDVTYEQVVDAAKLADAHEFICDFENGYDTVVGDNGAKLSGGQKQRIALARAILFDSEILILDEATNALDSLSEHEVFKTINHLAIGRTIILISHNLANIANADRIYVIDSGNVAEAGTMEELILNDGLFAELYSLQQAKLQQFSGNGVF